MGKISPPHIFVGTKEQRGELNNIHSYKHWGYFCILLPFLMPAFHVSEKFHPV